MPAAHRLVAEPDRAPAVVPRPAVGVDGAQGPHEGGEVEGGLHRVVELVEGRHARRAATARRPTGRGSASSGSPAATGSGTAQRELRREDGEPGLLLGDDVHRPVDARAAARPGRRRAGRWRCRCPPTAPARSAGRPTAGAARASRRRTRSASVSTSSACILTGGTGGGRRSGRLLVHGDLARAVRGERRPVPARPAVPEPEPGEPGHQVELGRPDVAVGRRVADQPSVHRPSSGATTRSARRGRRRSRCRRGRVRGRTPGPISPRGTRRSWGTITSTTKQPPGSR